MAKNEEKYLTKKEIAARLRCTIRCVNKWMRRGLPHIKFGSRKTLFQTAEVDAFLNKFHTGHRE